jgi:N4-(beta-N-acetylglucosaminyl)-L-asparaginase
MRFSRREFIETAAVTSAAVASAPGALAQSEKSGAPPAKSKTVIVCKYTGIQTIEAAYDSLRRGGDTLDAAIMILKGQEDDPNDNSVGLAGLPNEDGEVELDASVMHGPTCRAGAVGAVKRIKNVSLLAKTVMEHTGHVLIVGEGASKVAKLHGFPEENLLTERSRKIWQLWKETMSDQDWWGPGIADPNWKPPKDLTNVAVAEQRIKHLHEVAAEIGIEPEWRDYAVEKVMSPPTGTIPCITLNDKGEMSAAVSTSGLAWKITGRLGDSPIIGAGIYLDPDVGGAGVTGNGEENIKIAGSHTVVEAMRRGMEPKEAATEALKQLVRFYRNDMTRLRYINLVFHVLRRDGAYAGVALWGLTSSGKQLQIAVHDGSKRLENVSAMYEGRGLSWPPIPVLPKS